MIFTSPGVIVVVSVQLLSLVWFYVTPRTSAHQASLSLSPKVCLHSCPLSWGGHPTISSSVVPFPSCPQFFFSSIKVFSNELALHIRWSTYWSFSISPSNEYSGSVSLGWTGLISLLSKGLSRVFSSITIWKHQLFSTQPSLWSNSHIHTWLLEKP